MDSDDGGKFKSGEAGFRSRRWEDAVKAFMEATQNLAGWIKEQAGPPIGVFGSARSPEQIPKIYNDYGNLARQIGQLLGEQGYTLVTGACPGMPALVEQAFRQHRIVPAYQPVIGIRIELAPEFEAAEPDSPNVDFMLHTGSFGTRTELMEMSTEGGIFLPGGIGTELEQHVFAQLEQLRQYTRRGGPIILVGSRFWLPVMGRLRQLENWGTVGRNELQYHMVDRAQEVVPILRAFNSNAKRSAQIRAMAPPQHRAAS